MAHIDAALTSTPDQGFASVSHDAGRTVVWVGGEQDIATVAELSGLFARAIAADDGDLVVDLGEVQFMGTSTLDVILRVDSFLRARSRALVLRSPSPCARRVLDACGMADMVHDPVELTACGGVGALASWIEVPVKARVDPSALAPTVSGPRDQGVVAVAATL